MFDKTTLAMRRLALAAGVIGLAACGGGGDVAIPSPAASPLTLTPQTMNEAGSTALAAAESTLLFGQLAVDLTARFDASATGVDESCPNGGTLGLALLDRDGDGKASAGDRVTARLRDCGIPKLAQVLTGTVTIELTAASFGTSPALSATVDLGTGIELVAISGPTLGVTRSLLGTLAVEASRTPLKTTMAAASTPADDLRLVTARASGTATDALRAVAVRKEVAFAQARSIVDIALRIESETLGGSLSVSTPEPLRAWLNTFPEVGRVELRGAGATVLSLTPNFVVSSERYDLALDVDGDGVIERSDSLAWQDATSGYFWWDSRQPISWIAGAYRTQIYSSSAFTALMDVPRLPSGADPVRIQFTRVPVEFTTPRLRFQDGGSIVGSEALKVDVAATATRDGALVLVTPDLPLRHGRIYQLQISTDGGATWGNADLALTDALGNTAVLPGVLTAFATPDTMRAVAEADTTVLIDTTGTARLTGAASTSARAIASYRWTQLGGTPLAFDTPDAASTTVRTTAAPATNTEPVVVQLTITDSAGDTEFTRITLNLLRSVTTGTVLYLRSAPGDTAGGGRTAVFTDADGNFERSLSSGMATLIYRDFGLRQIVLLAVASSIGNPITPGVFATDGRPFQTGQSLLDVNIGGSGCLSPVGRFEVREVSLDALGAIATLAVDFEQHCDSLQAPPMFGSLRINSIIPLRP